MPRQRFTRNVLVYSVTEIEQIKREFRNYELDECRYACGSSAIERDDDWLALLGFSESLAFSEATVLMRFRSNIS